MKNWMKLSMLAAVLALFGLMALGTPAFAQGPVQTPPAGAQGTAPGYGMGGVGLGMGGPQNSLVAIAAKVLGLSQADLVAELNKGQTIAEVAKAKNISTDKIVAEFLAQHKATLDAAVKAGRITQAQADAQLDTIKTNVTTQLTSKWEPRGYGRGMGRGQGMGAGFVDADKDGICDLYQTNGQTGQTQPMGRGRWNR